MFKKSIFVMIMLAIFSVRGVVYSQVLYDLPTFVHYNGIEFTYEPEAFGALLPSYDAGTPYQVDAPYFANVAPHTSLKFFRPNPAYPDADWIAELRIYRIADLEAYAEPSYREVVQQLRNLDATNLSAYATLNEGYNTPTLPFMPVLNATQVFRVHPAVLNTSSLSGIEYYVYYGVSLEPLLEGQILYAFQGITTDSQYYVSFSIPVETGLLQTAFPDETDWDSFAANYRQYLGNIFTTVGNADPASFAPAPAVLHQFLESISIGL